MNDFLIDYLDYDQSAKALYGDVNNYPKDIYSTLHTKRLLARQCFNLTDNEFTFLILVRGTKGLFTKLNTFVHSQHLDIDVAVNNLLEQV